MYICIHTHVDIYIYIYTYPTISQYIHIPYGVDRRTEVLEPLGLEPPGFRLGSGR